MTTLPGLLFVDWYDSAVGQQFGVEGNVAVNGRMEAMWGTAVFTTPGVVGLLLALPLTALTMWRAASPGGGSSSRWPPATPPS